MQGQDALSVIQKQVKAMPWSERPDKGSQEFMAQVVLEAEGDEADIRAFLYGGMWNGWGFLCLTTRFLFEVYGDRSGTSVGRSPSLAQTGAISVTPSSGNYSSSHVNLYVLPQGIYIERCHARTARFFMDSFDSLHTWTVDNDPGAALSSLFLFKVGSVYDLPGISIDRPVAVTCYRDRLEFLQLTTGNDAVALPYPLIDSVSAAEVSPGLTSVTLNGRGFSLIGYTVSNPAEVQGLIAPAITELQASKMENQQAQQSPAPEVANDDASLLELIRQLATLKDQGLLSQDEFDSKKADLLARL